MANTSSAKKAARQAIKRTAINKTRRTRMRSEVRRVEEAIEAGNKDEAVQALRSAQPVIARSGQLGIVHANAASRKVSRLAKRIKAMA
ncbi:MAG: 30S ribosomal protein S20 [Hyphomicrobiaceae bacterium TMED74]|nr:30S ribosomal protein S20 [Filomicrobium sp.]RPG48009.1 MAG: 30S ribosomal protein S20 [Hyphomicrobiaceae bacterium TMED74]